MTNEAEVSADSVSLRYVATGTTSGKAAFIPFGPVCRQNGNTVYIAAPGGPAYQIRLFDLKGGLVFSETVSGDNTLQLPLNRFSKGIYLLHLLTTKEAPTPRTVIIK